MAGDDTAAELRPWEAQRGLLEFISGLSGYVLSGKL